MPRPSNQEHAVLRQEMEMFKTCLEEISLSGLEGCTVEELWTHLSNRQPAIGFELDEPTKSYIWRQLLSSIKPILEHCPVCLYLLPHPRESLVHSFPSGCLDYQHPHQYRFINDTTSSIPVKGSCVSYHERNNVTMEIANERPTLETASEKYGNSLVLVASQELRERVLTPVGGDSCLEVPDVQYGLLEVVGAARHYGISRPFVTSKYLKVDARSTFFYVKQLKKRGLIDIKNQNRSISESRTGSTFMLYLSAFKELDWEVPDKKEQFCSILSRAPYQCMRIKELYSQLGKRVKPLKKELVESGHVEKVLLKTVSEEYANDPDLANTQAIRLIKPYVAKEIVEDDDDDEDEGDDSSLKTPLIAELPLEMQAYRLIDSFGPAGIPFQDFVMRRGLDLGKFPNRSIANSLIKKSKVVAIIQDTAAIRTTSLVCASHVSKNQDYQQLHAEAARSGLGSGDLPILTGASYFPPEGKRERKDRKKTKTTELRAIKEDTPVIEPTNEVPAMLSVTATLIADLDVSAPDLSLNETVDQLHSRTPVSASLSRSVSPAPSLLGKVRHNMRTYKQIRRERIIQEFFEKYHVVSNLVNLSKYVRDEEHRDKLEYVVDNKTLNKMVTKLIADNKLCSRQVTFTADASDHTPSHDEPITQTITLFCAPSATEKEISAAQEAAHGAFLSATHRKALRTKVKKPKKQKAESQSDVEQSEDELVDIPNHVGFTTSRFQRLKHFHCYLWILAFGHSPETTSPQDSSDHALPDTRILSKTKWVSAVTKLPSLSKGPGWLNFYDITRNIPLSLFLILTKITKKIPSRFLPYFQDDQLFNGTLRDLPPELQKALVYNKDFRRDNAQVAHLLGLSEEVGILSMEGNNNPRDRSQLFAKLATTVTILDTSPCKPRRSFFLNDACSLFKETVLSLTCVADVERYWFDLQLICQQTPIILGERGPKKDPAVTDTHPLIYRHTDYINVKKRGNEWTAEFNQQGFGAGGLPPLLFSHSSRNWFYNHSVLDSHSHTVDSSTTESLPGVSLMDLPYTDMIDEECEGVEDVEGVPAAKRKKLSSSRGDGVCVITVPSSQVVRHEGGRGRERVRMKKVHKAVKTARKVISKQQSHQTQRFKVFNEISMVIEDDTLVKRDRGRGSDEGDKGQEGRTYWNTEQGNYILSAYLACCLLHRKGAPRVTYTQIRAAHLKKFPRSKCTITSVKRYLTVLLKKSPHIRSTLEVRMAECLQEMDSMGVETPELTLNGIVQFISKRSQASKRMLSQELLLPRTMEELYSNHTLIGGPKAKKSPTVPVVHGEREVTQALITDLIIATLGADESTYDQYKTFKLFESFPEADVKIVLDRLRQLQLIKRKKQKMVGVPAKQSPLETQQYGINHNFYAKLEGHFPPNLLQDTTDFLCVLDEDQRSSDEQPEEGERSSDGQPGVGWSEDILRVHGERARATTVAALLRAASRGIPMEVRAVLPEPLFEELADQPDDEDSLGTSLGEELDGGSDGEDKDEEEVKDGPSLTNEMIIRKLKYGTGGVSTLFGVGAGAVRHGYVEVEPSVCVGKLLERAQSEQYGHLQPSEEKMEEELTDQQLGKSHQKMTLDNYLNIGKNYLDFTDSDILFAQELYRIIDEGGDHGVQRSNLDTHSALTHSHHQHSLELHVQSLLNFDLIFRVGVCEECLVTSAHSGRWNMCATEDSHLHTAYRPWAALTPPHLNTPLLEKYQHGVLMHIMAHPGITLVDLLRHFTSTLTVNGLREILQVLELSYQIKSYHTLTRGECTLFGNNESSSLYFDYYEPVA